jgi:magnesium-transporting ATPase (P-type)
MKPYQQSIDDVVAEQKSDLSTGLTEKQIAQRLQKYGKNQLPQAGQESLFIVFLRQFQSPLLYILLGASIIVVFLGDYFDAFVISAVLLFNAIVGTILEGRAQSVLQKLREMAAGKAVVIRDGEKQTIDVRELVPGDIVVLRTGDQIPADARLCQAENLELDESLLTGESTGVIKSTDTLEGDVEVFERSNMVFNGTYVIGGNGTAVITSTGIDTQIGQMHKTIERVETDMPLQHEIRKISYWVLAFLVCTVVLLFFIGWLQSEPLYDLLLVLATLFIAVIPEGLPVVFTVVLASGAYRMMRHNVLVKRLHAVEGLGRVDVIVIDKTGTLTRNELVVTDVYADNTHYGVEGKEYGAEKAIQVDGDAISNVTSRDQLMVIAKACSLLNTAHIEYDADDDTYTVQGDPTEAAMAMFARRLDFDQDELHETYKEVHEIPFATERKLHAKFYKKGEKLIVVVAGAPETMFEHANHDTDAMQNGLQALLDKGLRVIAVATYETDFQEHDWTSWFDEEVLDNLIVVGLCGMQDVIRKEAPDMVQRARESGLHIVMATGDHKKTAIDIAEKTHIMQEGDKAMVGSTLRELSPADVKNALQDTTVFARVAPDDKVIILQALQKQGNRVAMTGDGINDVPSLAGADLGVAMGRSGTDVAKSAADLVLLDDAFSSIIDAIEEGRHIFYTLHRVVLYFFSTNFAEILIILFAIIVAFPLPVYAIQLLWLNFVSDAFLDIGLAMEPREDGLLKKQWLKRSQEMGLVDRTLAYTVVYMAVPMAIGSLWAFAQYRLIDLEKARTMTLVVLTMFQWFNAWNCRSETKSLFSMSPFANPWLILATACVAVIQLGIIYLPFFQTLFKTVPLGWYDWGLAVMLGSTIILFDEIRKFAVRSWRTS